MKARQQLLATIFCIKFFCNKKKRHCTFPFPQLIFGCKGAAHQIEFLKGPVTQLCTSLDKFCAHVLCYIAGGSVKNINTVSMCKNTYSEQNWRGFGSCICALYPCLVTVVHVNVHWSQCSSQQTEGMPGLSAAGTWMGPAMGGTNSWAHCSGREKELSSKWSYIS